MNCQYCGQGESSPLGPPEITVRAGDAWASHPFCRDMAPLKEVVDQRNALARRMRDAGWAMRKPGTLERDLWDFLLTRYVA